MAKNKNVPFDQVIEALLDNNMPFPPHLLHCFSDLPQTDFNHLKNIWKQINPSRRATLLEDLEFLAETDTLLCFDDLASFALDDEIPAVREAAIHLLWETEDAKLAPRFVRLLNEDEDENVRAAAAGALGLFVYLGELEHIPPETQRDIEETLLDQFTRNVAKPIRRKALESLGYSGRDEVCNLIETAFATNESEWQASALLAMGRSADIRWEPQVLKMLNHPNPLIQEEAIRAAGELELAAAREPLLELLQTRESLDDDVFAALVWSLSQIGGENVRSALEDLLEESEDEDESEYIESALENLEFTDNYNLMEMFDFDIDSKDNLDNEIDLRDQNSSEDEETA